MSGYLICKLLLETTISMLQDSIETLYCFPLKNWQLDYKSKCDNRARSLSLLYLSVRWLDQINTNSGDFV